MNLVQLQIQEQPHWQGGLTQRQEDRCGLTRMLEEYHGMYCPRNKRVKEGGAGAEFGVMKDNIVL